ncbi:hypothetical protein ILYODFUR_016087 [Ilyodon furcidens]|uniref:Uncharacterized protein n=1 Tax=Ilyodon furcidens TaxID=33524 RepID=A0ABV0SNT0_9TELE
MPGSLLSAVTERDLPRLLLLLAHSTKEQINTQLAATSSPTRTALHAACHLGDVVMTQLLVWVGLFMFCGPFCFFTVQCSKCEIGYLELFIFRRTNFPFFKQH